MDWQLLTTILKIIIFLPVILLLIYLSAKIGGGKLQNIQNGRYIKILERVAVSKDNFLMAAKIGEKGYVISSSSGKIEVLMEISDKELSIIESSKNMNLNLNSYKDICNKFKLKKEDRDE